MTGRLSNWPIVVLLTLAGGALFYCYWDVFSILVRQWSTIDAYSHGFLIPAISLYFVWHRRHRLAALPLAGALVTGACTLGLGLGILLLGRALDIVGIQQLSLLPTLAGLVLLVAGGRALRLLWFPIAYLAFMMPVWDVATERMHYPFQQLSAAIGAKLLHLGGVPVLHQGTYLHLPNITLEVARVCSGVNYLVAVAAVGVPLAYLVFPDWLRRGLLVTAGLAIAILANPVRVALIGAFSYFGLSADVHGPGHAFQGLFVAAVGYAGLLGGVAVLSRWDRRRPDRLTSTTPSTTGASTATSSVTAPLAGTAPVASPAPRRAALQVAIAVGLLIAGGSVAAPSLAADSGTPPWLASLPASIGTWQSMDSSTAETAGAPRVYRGTNGQRVELRFGSVIQTRGSAPDEWTARVARQVTPFVLDLSGDTRVTVNRAADARGAVPVLYWYDVDGRIVDDRIRARLHTTWHRLTGRGRAPVGVFVAAASATANPDEAMAGVTEFARELVVVLRNITS